jgi:hypothetical protein
MDGVTEGVGDVPVVLVPVAVAAPLALAVSAAEAVEDAELVGTDERVAVPFAVPVAVFVVMAVDTAVTVVLAVVVAMAVETAVRVGKAENVALLVPVDVPVSEGVDVSDMLAPVEKVAVMVRAASETVGRAEGEAVRVAFDVGMADVEERAVDEGVAVLDIGMTDTVAVIVGEELVPTVDVAVMVPRAVVVAAPVALAVAEPVGVEVLGFAVPLEDALREARADAEPDGVADGDGRSMPSHFVRLPVQSPPLAKQAAGV